MYKYVLVLKFELFSLTTTNDIFKLTGIVPILSEPQSEFLPLDYSFPDI